MNILVIGEPVHFKESEEKFGERHQYSFVNEHRDAEKFLVTHDLVLDFIIDEEPHQFEIYAHQSAKVFLNTVKISLGELMSSVDQEVSSVLFGFNGLPTFLKRDILEVSLLQKADEAILRELCQQLQTDYLIVDDRVGLVTPRVICMIINEAFYTVQEGTATPEDIDMAMKLGTNYPWGPFEWCEKIGVKHVYEVLEAVYDDTKDERYKICPLLKKRYLKDNRSGPDSRTYGPVLNNC